MGTSLSRLPPSRREWRCSIGPHRPRKQEHQGPPRPCIDGHLLVVAAPVASRVDGSPRRHANKSTRDRGGCEWWGRGLGTPGVARVVEGSRRLGRMSSGGGSRSSLCSSSNRSHFCFLVNQRHCQGRRPLHLAHAREDDGDKKVDWSTRLWREWRAGGTRRRRGRRRGHNISSVFFVVTGVAEPLPSTLGVSELHDNKRRSPFRCIPVVVSASRARGWGLKSGRGYRALMGGARWPRGGTKLLFCCWYSTSIIELH